MKVFFQKIWSAFVNFLHKVSCSKWLYFIAGLVIAAFFYIDLHMTVCIVPVIFAGIFKEFFAIWIHGKGDWKNLAVTCAGGIVIQIMVLAA